LTYCAICALSFLERIPEGSARGTDLKGKGDIVYEECVHCIVSRQSTHLEEVDEEEHQLDAAMASAESLLRPSPVIGYLPHLGPLSLDEEPHDQSAPPLHARDEDMQYVGFNGRPNKVVDTCYSFWNLGALAVCASHSCFLPKIN
jgi:geranylgeranyl transferase type-1 subunit beta